MALFVQPRFDRGDQVVDPFSAQRRYRNRPPGLQLPFGQIKQPRAGIAVEPVDLVPDLDQPGIGRLNTELGKNLFDIVRLRGGILVRHIAHVQDDVGLDHLLQRGAERRHQHGRQVGDEADGVGQNDAVAVRQRDAPQRRVERREQHIGRQHARRRHAIEQRRLTGIGVADQRHGRIRHPLAAVAMQLAGALDLLEFAFDALDAVFDHSPVGFELRLARAAEKAVAAALALKMGPGADQTAFLIIEMRVLDLQRAFAGAGAPAEDFQNQSGAIDDLRAPGFFEIALLHRGDWAVHHHHGRGMAFDQPGNLVDLAGADIGRRPHVVERDQSLLHDIEVDGARQSGGFFEASLGRARLRLRAAGLAPHLALEPRLDHDGAAGLRARRRRAQEIGAFVTLALFQSDLVPSRRLFAAFEQLDRVTGHDGRNRVLVDELGMPIPPQQNAEIIEPCHDALQFNAVDQENGQRNFCFADVIEESVLQILRTFGCHGRVPFFCPRLTRETFVARVLHTRVLPHVPLSPTQKRCQAQDIAIRWQVVSGCKHKLARNSPKR